MDNSTRRQLLDRARSAGYPGSILDAFTAYDQGRDLIGEFVNQQQQAAMQPPMQVAQTPEEQGQGLRPYHEQGQINQSMAFPNVQPGQSFNTMGMKVPINIDKIDNQGNLVESYKAVPPGIANLPTGPYEGTVIESPARMQKGGKRRDPDQPFFESETEEGTYEAQYSQPEVTVTPDWTAEEIERNKLRDEYIAKDKKFFRHWYDKLGYDKKNVIKRANQFAYNTLAKQYLKEDPENLTPEQIKFIKKSEYANRLEPSVGERFVTGLGDLVPTPISSPKLNLETLGNLAAPFEYPGNLVRGAVKGEFIDAVKGRTPSPYFVSSDLAGTSPTEAAIASGVMTAGTDPLFLTGDEIFKGTGQSAKALSKSIKKLPKATKNEILARYISNAVDKGKLPTIVEKQTLSPRVDPINRSSVNVKNDIFREYGEDYDTFLNNIYQYYKDVYDMPLVEFKSSKPSSFVENLGAVDNAEGVLFKEKYCLPGSECAKTSNAVTNKLYSDVTGEAFATQENAHNAWHLEDQMTRHGGENVTETILAGNPPKVGDRVLMGNQVDQSTYVPGYTADPEVRHAGVVVGYQPNKNGDLVPMIFESGKDAPMFYNPISNTFTGQNSVRQIIRPRQFLDETFGKALVDKNIRYAFRDKPSVAKYSSESKPVQSILTEAESHREKIKRMHDLTNDEFDELTNSLIGIGAQETKLNASLPSSKLPAAKVKLQNVLADMGLTEPIKRTINVGKRTANSLTKRPSTLPEYPGTSNIEMEAAKLADKEGIPFSTALKTVKSQYQPKPKFTPSTVEPSKGMFRQKFKTENARTSDFEHHLTNDPVGHGLSQMAENYNKIKKLYPEATPRQLIDLTTLMWNSPGKAQNKKLVEFYLMGKDNPNPSKFKFDYVSKVNKFKDELINIHPQSVERHMDLVRGTLPEIQYKLGGSYQTNQETAMYEWRSGLPEDSRKRYIKGGLKNRVLYNKAKYKR
jgi:hypothetical protein